MTPGTRVQIQNPRSHYDGCRGTVEKHHDKYPHTTVRVKIDGEPLPPMSFGLTELVEVTE